MIEEIIFSDHDISTKFQMRFLHFPNVILQNRACRLQNAAESQIRVLDKLWGMSVAAIKGRLWKNFQALLEVQCYTTWCQVKEKKLARRNHKAEMAVQTISGFEKSICTGGDTKDRVRWRSKIAVSYWSPEPFAAVTSRPRSIEGQRQKKEPRSVYYRCSDRVLDHRQ